MKIYKNELYRLLSTPTFLLIAMGVFLVNIYFSFTNQPVTVSDEYYREYYSSLEGLTAEECIEKTQALVDGYSYDNFDYNEFQKRIFHNAQLEQAKTIAGYREYIQSIDAAAENMSSISIFSGDKNSFTYRNIQMTPAAYDPVRSVQPVFSPSAGVLSAVDNTAADILLIFIALAAVTVLIGRERESGITALLKPLKHYKTRLAVSKITALFSVCFFCGIIIYGSALLIGAFRFGLDDLSRPVQSLEGFIGCNLPISVSQLILFTFLIKIIASFAVTLIFQTLLSKLSSLFSYGIFIGAAAVEIAAYAFISPVSAFSFFGYINFAAFMNSGGLFKTYQNINVFNIPVNLITSTIISLAIVIIISAFLFINFFGSMDIAPAKKLRIPLPRIFTKEFKRPFSYSLYKTFFTHKSAVIILTVLSIQLYSCFASVRAYNIDDNYYRRYCDEMAGLSPAQAEEYIEQTEAYFEQLMTSGSFNDDLNGITGFYQAKEQYEYISALDTENKAMFYETGWHLLFGGSGWDKDISPALIALLATCIAISPLLSYDNRIKIGCILFATKSGYTSYITRCISSAFISAILISAAVYIPHILNICRLYGTDGITYSIRCLPQWNGFLDIPILAWLIVLPILRTVILLLLTLVILGISSLCKSTYAAQLIAFAIFALPAAIYLIGAKFVLPIVPPLSVNREITEGQWFYSFLLILMAVYSVFVLYRRKER